MILHRYFLKVADSTKIANKINNAYPWGLVRQELKLYVFYFQINVTKFLCQVTNKIISVLNQLWDLKNGNFHIDLIAIVHKIFLS